MNDDTTPENMELETTSPDVAPAETPAPTPEAAAASTAPTASQKRGENARGTRGGRRNDERGGERHGGKKGRSRRGETEEKEFQETVLDVARVTRVVKGGRRLRFRVTVIIGNLKGRVGMGIGKSVEVAVAVKKAVAEAKKNLINIPLVNGTIPHEITWKHKSARLLLMPARPGTGIIAGGAVRKIAALGGIQDLLGKSYGTNNPLVNAQAMMQALQGFYTKGENIIPERLTVAVAE